MKVIKAINNNLVKSIDEKDNEILVMGCGLGFKRTIGDEIDDKLIDKVYKLSGETSYNKLINLLENIPLEQIQVTNEIVSFAKMSLGKKLNENIYISLSDHINFAIERYNNKMPIKNALLWEIKKLYNHEFLVGKEALNIIKRRLNVDLPEDEAGFIALHLVNSLMDDMSMNKTTDMTKIIQKILNIIKYHFNLELDEYSIHYERLITHLKFFIQRIYMGTVIDDQDNQFIEILKEKYKKEYECTLKIKDYIKSECNCELTEDEMIYLTMHINRITSI